MSERISQSQLDGAIERLNKLSKVQYETNNCYGYYQLRIVDGSSVYSTLGCTKKELYYQIHFLLDHYDHLNAEEIGAVQN